MAKVKQGMCYLVKTMWFLGKILGLGEERDKDSCHSAMSPELRPKMVFNTGRSNPVGRVTMAGLLRQHPGMPEKPTRTLGSYALFYLLRGTGTFRDATGPRRKLVPGDLVTVFPDIPHWYGPSAGRVWDEFFVVFSGKVFDLWRAEGLLSPARPVCHLEPLEYWLQRLEEVVEKLDSLQQVCLLQNFLAEAFKASAPAQEPGWLDRARHLLGGTEPISPSEVARKLGMSYESFRKQFAAVMGMSPKHYRVTEVIERACRMIAEGGATNKEIAQRLDFCDEFDFSHRFKEIVGVSPMDFRLRLPREARKGTRHGGRGVPDSTE
jgi:AraC-like DNA-binding protein